MTTIRHKEESRMGLIKYLEKVLGLNDIYKENYEARMSLVEFLSEHDTEIFACDQIWKKYPQLKNPDSMAYGPSYPTYCWFLHWQHKHMDIVHTRKMEDSEYDSIIALAKSGGVDFLKRRYHMSKDQTPFRVTNYNDCNGHLECYVFEFFPDNQWQLHIPVRLDAMPFKTKDPSLCFEIRNHCFSLRPDFGNIRIIAEKLKAPVLEEENKKRKSKIAEEENLKNEGRTYKY